MEYCKKLIYTSLVLRWNSWYSINTNNCYYNANCIIVAADGVIRFFPFAGFRLIDHSVWWDGSVWFYHTFGALSTIFSFWKIFPSGKIRLVLYHFFGYLSSKKLQQQKKFFCQDFFQKFLWNFSRKNIISHRVPFVK